MNTKEKLEICKMLIESRLNTFGEKREITLEENRLVIECNEACYSLEIRIYIEAASSLSLPAYISYNLVTNKLETIIHEPVWKKK